MANKTSDTRGDGAKNPLDPAEWDFEDVPEGEKWACMAYELLRESAFMHEEAAAMLGLCKQAAKKAGHDLKSFPPPEKKEFFESYTASRMVTLAYMKLHGFPELPWQQIKDWRVRKGIGESLFLLSVLPESLEYGATVSAAIRLVKLVQDDDLREKLRQNGVEGTTALCWIAPSLPEKEMYALLIDPSADEAIILEGVKAYLPHLRKEEDLTPSPEKEKKGGRRPKYDDSGELLKVLGLMRLAYYLPAKLAWEKSRFRNTETEVNIAIKRARETCAAAMHARFELPEGEKPIHYKRPR